LAHLTCGREKQRHTFGERWHKNAETTPQILHMADPWWQPNEPVAHQKRGVASYSGNQTDTKIYVKVPREGLGLNTSFFWRRENHHEHLVDRVSPFLYPLMNQSIHLQTKN
jgi:hypothetical protein